MNRKKLIKVLASMSVCALSCGILVGCQFGGGSISSTDISSDYEWSYVREFVDEHDPEMTIDGVLDEDLWEGQQYLYHKERNVSMSYTTVFTSYGVYIGAIAEDTHLQWNGRFNFFGPWTNEANNSSFMFKVQGADVTEEHTTTVFNFFVDAKNAASRNQTHFEAKASVNGDIDKGEATKMVAELFVSWDALNIDIPEGQDYPDYVRIQPLYRYVEEVDSASNKWLTPLFSEYGETRLLHRSRFASYGYINADSEDAVLGDAANGISKSDGWDLTNMDRGMVKSDTYHGQAIFFKNLSSDSYVYSANVKITNESWGLNGHGGVCDMIDSEYFNAFYIAGYTVTSGTTKLNFHTLNFIRDESGSNWHDTNEGNYTVPAGKDPYNNGIDIKVIKQEEKFFYFIYDELVLCKEIPVLSGDTCPGLYTLSRCVEFTNYQAEDYADRQDELNALILEDAYKVSAPGNISGGVVSSDKAALIKKNGVCSQDVVLTIVPNAEYILTSLNITGTSLDENYLPYFMQNCKDGVLVIDKSYITGNVEVTAKYTYLSKCDLYDTKVIKISGQLKDSNGKAFSGVEVYLKNANATFCYKIETTSRGAFSFSVPREGNLRLPDGQEMALDGKYTLYINIPGYRVISEEIHLTRQQFLGVTKNYTVQKATLGGSVTVGSKVLTSDGTGWDYTLDTNKVVSTSKTPNAIAYFTDVVTNDGAIIQATVKNTTDTSLENHEQEPGIGFIVNNSWKMVKFLLAGSKVKVLQDGSWNKVSTYTSDVDFNTRIGDGAEEYTIRLLHEDSMFVFQMLDGREWITLCQYTDTAFDNPCAYGLTATAGSSAKLGVEYSNYSAKVGVAARETIEEVFYTPFNVTFNYFDGTTETVQAKHGEGLINTPSHSLESFDKNDMRVVPKVNGNTVELTDEFFKGLLGDTVIEFSYEATGLLVYDKDTESFKTNGGTGGGSNKYSLATITKTISGDFELSMDVKWTSGSSWPVEAFMIKDENGQTVEFIVGRIFVGAQANAGWLYMGEDAGNSNVKWCRNLNGWGGNYGTKNSEGGYDFTFKVVVKNGVATMYVDEFYCYDFKIADINPNFDLTDTYSVRFGTRDVQGTGTTYISNWKISDEISSESTASTYTVTLNYPDGTTETIVRNENGLSKEPSKGYNYSSYNGVAIAPYVNGRKITLTKEYLMSLGKDTVIDYKGVQSGSNGLVYNGVENRMEATARATEYSEVLMTDTVSGDFELSMDVKWFSGTSWPITAFSLKDSKGQTVQLIFGRIYVGAQANWGWVNMNENSGNSNVQWCRSANGWPWNGQNGTSNNDFGTKNDASEGGCHFTAKVVVKNGIASMYVDNVHIADFNLSAINPNFNVNDALEVKLCVREVYSESSTPKIYITNWKFKDDLEA